MSLNRSGVTVNGAGGELAYMGGDGTGGDVEFGSRNPGIGTASFYTPAIGQFMNLSARAFNQASDRASKENFAPVDVGAILDSLDRLPLTRWNYKGEPGTTHLGPIAQDFHAAFGLGADDQHIATVDENGVALAAIQALHRQLQVHEKISK